MLRGRRGLSKGGRIFDLGAHQGVVALMLSRYVGEQGSVLAVEADAARRTIEINAARNGTGE